MVGRLVEKDDVRLLGEHAGKRRLAAFAARQRGRIGGGREFQLVECGRRLVFLRAARHRIIDDARSAAEIRHLFEIGDARARLTENLAAIGLGEAGRDSQQGGFAASVSPDKAKPVTRRERETRARNQDLIGKRDADVAKGKERSGQCRSTRLH